MSCSNGPDAAEGRVRFGDEFNLSSEFEGSSVLVVVLESRLENPPFEGFRSLDLVQE